VGFVEAIEAALAARRGREQALSPRDFALARTWFDAGLPLATVLVGIDRAFDAEPSTTSLVFCRRYVEQLTSPGARPAAAWREGERPRLPDVAERLAGLRERLEALPGRAAALPLQEVVEVSDLVAVASRPNWDYLRSRLDRIDALVTAMAVEALDPQDLSRLRDEARRAAERHRGHVDGRALEEAVKRLLRQRAREELRLPRVAVE
jgi:hypothetical protein